MRTRYFARSESTCEYFTATTHYLRVHGRPVAFYSDKAAIFRVNAKEARAGDGFTQFGRAMHDLNIDVICANTPAHAKTPRIVPKFGRGSSRSNACVDNRETR